MYPINLHQSEDQDPLLPTKVHSRWYHIPSQRRTSGLYCYPTGGKRIMTVSSVHEVIDHGVNYEGKIFAVFSKILSHIAIA